MPPAPTLGHNQPTVAEIIRTIQFAGGDTVDMVMNPEELGRLRFEIAQSGDQMRITLTVERPETLELLRRHADQLLTEFRQAGYAGATLSFGQWGEGGRQDAPSPLEMSERDHPDAARPAEPQTATRPASSTSGLDLRL
ncbi:MAG: flagellar hook-length control protein FliK [Paracoccaceae bacterium]